MELKQHIGIYVLMLLVLIVIWLFGGKRIHKEHSIISPIGAALLLFVIFEAFFWTIKFFFVH